MDCLGYFNKCGEAFIFLGSLREIPKSTLFILDSDDGDEDGGF